MTWMITCVAAKTTAMESNAEDGHSFLILLGLIFFICKMKHQHLPWQVVVIHAKEWKMTNVKPYVQHAVGTKRIELIRRGDNKSKIMFGRVIGMGEP